MTLCKLVCIMDQYALKSKLHCDFWRNSSHIKFKQNLLNGLWDIQATTPYFIHFKHLKLFHIISCYINYLNIQTTSSYLTEMYNSK
jgi:hypothetical protein